MDKKAIAGIAIMALIVSVALVLTFSRPATSAGSAGLQSGTQPPSAQTQNQSNSTKVLFSSTQYAPYSYEISPGPVSQQAQSALAGFNVTSTPMQNGSTEIVLSLTGTNQRQSLLLKPGYKLYIVETAFGDDGYHFDSSLGDDGFVIVDPSGYIAQ